MHAGIGWDGWPDGRIDEMNATLHSDSFWMDRGKVSRDLDQQQSPRHVVCVPSQVISGFRILLFVPACFFVLLARIRTRNEMFNLFFPLGEGGLAIMAMVWYRQYSAERRTAQAENILDNRTTMSVRFFTKSRICWLILLPVFALSSTCLRYCTLSTVIVVPPTNQKFGSGNYCWKVWS